MVSDFTKVSLPGDVVNDVLSFCARQNVSRETFFVAAWSCTVAIYNAAPLITTSVIRHGEKGKSVIEFNPGMSILGACSALKYTKICSGADFDHSSHNSTSKGELDDDSGTVLFAQGESFDLNSGVDKHSFLPNIVIDIQHHITLRCMSRCSQFPVDLHLGMAK